MTQFTSGLIYKGESGALNEHFSDVFGTTITQWANGETPETADWLIGDEIMGPQLFGEALRSMRSPGTAYDNSILGKDPQPATYADRYTGTADNGGVHLNSGIPNRAFYTVATTLGGHAWDAAGKIWYASLSDSALGSGATFQDFAKLTLRNAQRTYGATSREAQAVQAGWSTVKVPTT